MHLRSFNFVQSLDQVSNYQRSIIILYDTHLCHPLTLRILNHLKVNTKDADSPIHRVGIFNTSFPPLRVLILLRTT